MKERQVGRQKEKKETEVGREREKGGKQYTERISQFTNKCKFIRIKKKEKTPNQILAN